MSKRLAVCAVLATAMVFGVILSGCNRDRDHSSRPSRGEKRDRGRSARAKQNPDNDTGWVALRPDGQRPAEVLASSVRRSPAQVRQLEQIRPGRSMAPQPISASEFARASGDSPSGGYRYRQAETAYAAPRYYESGVPHTGYLAPATAQAGYPAAMPVYDPPAPVVVMSPQLAVAQASLEPAPVLNAYIPNAAVTDLVVPAIQVQQFPAPIPELEPVRYQRVATPEPSPLPKPVMMSEKSPFENLRPARQIRPAEVERALAPLAVPAQAAREWVPSPVTAMRRAY